ncbi:hypothetical protein HG15A2_39520 [Adhaeretor mobilis]|uniref:Uncharacterized protein n=1 Tax=Adhaeretor mobilis TaxID=1930276 RepID=A0A517N0F8_9BACT|nr:hypothetical protein HG15A2_39520 [Adhaeretor mobilis]
MRSIEPVPIQLQAGAPIEPTSSIQILVIGYQETSVFSRKTRFSIICIWYFRHSGTWGPTAHFLATKLTPAIATAMPAKCCSEEGSSSTTIARSMVSVGPTEPMTVVRVAPMRTIASLIM